MLSLPTAPLARVSSFGATTLALSMLTIGPTACTTDAEMAGIQRDNYDPELPVDYAKKLFSEIKPGRSFSIPYHCRASSTNSHDTNSAARAACQYQLMDFQRIVNDTFGQQFTVTCDIRYSSNSNDSYRNSIFIQGASCLVTKLPLQTDYLP